MHDGLVRQGTSSQNSAFLHSTQFDVRRTREWQQRPKISAVNCDDCLLSQPAFSVDALSERQN
jgi:hypothetical protein